MKWVLWVAVLPVAAVLDAVLAATGRPAAHPNEEWVIAEDAVKLISAK